MNRGWRSVLEHLSSCTPLRRPHPSLGMTFAASSPLEMLTIDPGRPLLLIDFDTACGSAGKTSQANQC